MTLQEKKMVVSRALSVETAALEPMQERVNRARAAIEENTKRQDELRQELVVVAAQLLASRNEYEQAWEAMSTQQRRISHAKAESMQVATPRVS